jgi:putative hydrolase of the HAD superfamily
MKIPSGRVAIFDLDDTLVDTSHVYWLSRTAFLDCVSQAGFDRELALASFEDIDSKNIVEHGYLPERYERSMLDTYRLLCERQARDLDAKVLAAIRLAGSIVREQVPSLIPAAIELVEGARALGYFVVLLTRGVRDVQQRKLHMHNLAAHFEMVEIVAKKDAKTLKRVMDEIGVSGPSCWVIGDSIKSDINPAIEAGANGILYLYTHHAYYWRQEYGVEPLGQFYLAHDLPEVLRILTSPSVAPLTRTLPAWDPLLPH